MNNPHIDDYGTKHWYNEKGQWHREDGPAEEYADGDKRWYMNGSVHRLDGPAVENSDGGKAWWYHNEWIICDSQEEFERLIKLRMFW